MKKAVIMTLALVCLVVFTSPVLAGPDCEKACDKTKAKACDAKVACAGKSGCDLSAKLNIAKVIYRVGDFQTACKTTAASVAASTGDARTFLVDGKCYKDPGKAVNALTSILDKQAADMQVVRFVVGKDCVSCPKAAASLAKNKDAKVIYRVAGHDFACDKKAAKVAAAAKKAARTVAMQYKVGKDCVSCPNAAASIAKSSGKKLQFQIGKKTTSCKFEAKLLMAQAKIQAIYAAGEPKDLKLTVKVEKS